MPTPSPTDITSIGELLISPSTLWTLLAIVAVVFIVVSSIMHFHWRSYAIQNKTITRAMRAYYGVSIILILVAGAVVMFI